MKNENLYLGVDVGTSSLKLILINDDCRILKQDSEKYILDSPQMGWLEIDPEIWIKAFVSAADRLLRDIDRSKIKRIGVTGQMHTLVLLGEKGKAIRPAMMWNDLRTKEIIPSIKEDIRSFDDGEYLSKIISTGSPLANLIWIKQNEPEVFKAIKGFQIGWDYLVYRLTGRRCTDYCNASTSALYSLNQKCWSSQIRDYVGLDAVCYPEVCGSAELAGKLSAEFQERLLLSGEVEVIVGTGDNPATVISTGSYWSKHPVFSLGTSGVLTRIFSSEQSHYVGKKILFAFYQDECGLLEQGAIQSCGNTYDWWNQQFGNMDMSMNLETEIDIQDKVKDNVLFYPHLMGDKTLYSDPELRGMFAGIDIKTDKKSMHYAVLEGICFSIRELIERMNAVTEVREVLQVVGGGSDNNLWMQMLSNILGTKIEKLNGNTGAVYGIAFLTARINRLDELQEIINDRIEIKMSYMPDESLKADYGKKYDCYLRMRNAMHYIYGGAGNLSE